MRLLDEGVKATSAGQGKTWRTSWEAMLRKGAKWADRQGVQDPLFALPPINLGIQWLAEAARGTRFHARAAVSAETTQ